MPPQLSRPKAKRESTKNERLQCYRWDISIPGNVTDMLCPRHWDIILYPKRYVPGKH